MSAEILDGKALAKSILEEVREKVSRFTKTTSVVPTLAAVLVGEDSASEVYVRNKRRSCEKVGIDSQLHRLPAATTEDGLLALVNQLNNDPAVHGILVQLPLPSQIDSTHILDAVNPRKDVDAFHPDNVGRLVQGRPRFLPCTPHGILQLLHRSNIEVTGKHVVVVGRSDIVGKPLVMMLAQRDSALGSSAVNATVTICHSLTCDLPRTTKSADILVAAIGRPAFITADMVGRDAVVVDVGINRTDSGLVGDVDFAAVREIASHITPVPGGVGPLTVAMLMHNTFTAAQPQFANTSETR